jgi:hypothetical protein
MTVEEKLQSKINPLLVRAGIVILGILFFLLIVSRLVYPFGAGTWEAFNWMPATHLLEDKNPFSFAFTPPYSIPPYGIVYYILIAVGVKLFGFQLWFGRLLSIASFAVCVFSAAQITKKTTRSSSAFGFVILASLAMFPAQIWIAVMRSDLIAAAFGLAALWLAFGIDEGEKVKFRRIAVMILLTAATFFTKQSFLLPTAIVFLRLLQLKKWRDAIYFAFGIAGLTVAVMFLLDYTSAGGYFWQHFVHAENLPFAFADSFRVFFVMLAHPTFFFSIIFLLIFVFQKRKIFRQLNREKLTEILRSPQFLLFIYCLLSGAWAFISAGRQGGAANYYIENSFALAIAVGLVYDNFRRESLQKWTLAIVILLTFGGIFQFIQVFRGEYFRWQSLSYYREIFDTTANFTPSGSTCVSVYPELAVWNGCAFYFDDFEEYIGIWSPEFNEIFEHEIKQERFAAIIWYDDKLQAKFPNYQLIPMSQKPPQNFLPVYLYVPKSTLLK